MPEASIFPSSAGIAGSGGASIFDLILFSVNLCLGVMCRESVQIRGQDLLAHEQRRPLLQKRRRPFLLIFRGATHAEQSRL